MSTLTTQAEGNAAGETLHGMIEDDADVHAGDSGGPLYDSEGEVVGIDTAGSSGPEIDSYAIPIGNALSLVQQVLAGQATSTVQIGASPFLGVELSPATVPQDGAVFPGRGTGTGMSGVAGATVSDVVADGPAASAGLQAGDTISALDGTDISSVDQVAEVLAQHKPGDSVEIGWFDSSGTAQSGTVVLAQSPVN